MCKTVFLMASYPLTVSQKTTESEVRKRCDLCLHQVIECHTEFGIGAVMSLCALRVFRLVGQIHCQNVISHQY